MFTKINKFRFWILPFAMIALFCRLAPAQSSSSTEQETKWLSVLRSDAAPSEKAIACKHLAIHGSSDSVAELAKLLPNPQLSSWARTALEVIPDAAADKALRDACESLQGRLLAGTLNSIGVRRDAAAVELLSARLQDSDVEVASAAAVALGRVGNSDAAKSLQQALTSTQGPVRDAVAEGYVLCAEGRFSAGEFEAATKIYDEIRQAEVPQQRMIEATRGAILARKQAGIPLLIETFQSADDKLFQLALGTARELAGSEVDQALASQLASAIPERAALIVQAMSDRPGTVQVAAIIKAAESGNQQVRLSAIDALQRVGDVSCLPVLLAIAVQDETELAQAAKVALAGLAGEGVDAELAALLTKAEGKSYPLLIELVGQRRIQTVPDLLKALKHSDTSVRHAALVSLGETVSLDQLPELIAQVVSPKDATDLEVAGQALKAASIRMPDREACATQIAQALIRAQPATRSLLLEILSDVGGTKALATLADAAKSNDPELQDTGSRLLGKWNNVAAAPVLLDLAKSAPAEKYQVRALRGFIGIARKFTMSDEERAAMCKSALETASRDDEKKLVLEVLQIHPSVATLELALNAKKFPAIKEDATATSLVIARKLGEKGVDVSELMTGAGLDPIKLEIVKAEYGADATQKDVTEIVRKLASNVALIPLKSNFNATFGDPAPGIVKRLRIQYRMNGRNGEATFAENALIILPSPR
ncbi:MAG: HEAT repeat domain-containing protein [Pirellulaceae bacterium]